MELIFEKASPLAIDKIMEILAEARKTIGALGIDQWQNGYPDRDTITEDISAGRSYVVRNDHGEICATFCLKEDGEVTYEKIYDGEWLTPGDFFALHRIAISVAERGRGIADGIIDFIVKKSALAGVRSVRVDTHEGNLPMRKMLERNGFRYCGIIYLLNGEKRVAYEKII